MECSLCKTQNVGKTKTFNISVNNHRSDKIDSQSIVILPKMDITSIFMEDSH